MIKTLNGKKREVSATESAAFAENGAVKFPAMCIREFLYRRKIQMGKPLNGQKVHVSLR